MPITSLCICAHKDSSHHTTDTRCNVEGCTCTRFDAERSGLEPATVQQRGAGLYTCRRATVRELLTMPRRPLRLMDVIGAMGRD